MTVIPEPGTRRERGSPARPLLEREAEVAALSALVEAARSGDGRLVGVEGAAGIGKTRLLAEARALATEFEVLSARAGELESDFAFGVVFGALAYRANSILPGMTLHCFFDLIQFVAGRKIAAAVRTLPLIWESGPDRWLWIECTAFVLLGVASILAYRKLVQGKTTALPVAPGEL